MGWQQMKTVPKDGTHLLLWCDFGGRDREICIASYTPATFGGARGPFVWKTSHDGGAIAESVPLLWHPLPHKPDIFPKMRKALGKSAIIKTEARGS